MLIDDHFWRTAWIAASSGDEAFKHLRVLDSRVHYVQVSVRFGQQTATGQRRRGDVQPRHYAIGNFHFQSASRNAWNRSRPSDEDILYNDITQSSD